VFSFVFRYSEQMWSNLANRNRHGTIEATPMLTETPGFARFSSHRRNGADLRLIGSGPRGRWFNRIVHPHDIGGFVVGFSVFQHYFR